jgi:hypothetical protein
VLFLEKQQSSSQDFSEKKEINPIYSTDQLIPLDIKSETVKNQDASSKKTAEEKPTAISKKIEQQVPFIVQAPFGNWSDPNFQNACEEASIVMVMGWINGEKNISAPEAQERILEIIDFESQTFGYSIDTDASDIERIFREYFKHTNVQARENITLEDIQAELQKGRVVIAPAFGQALNNPNFTQPGPIVHMLLIIGYDPLTKQFITNDPGTKNGASYEYAENVLFAAIWAYPSGPTNPPLPTGKMMKALISVGK